MASRNLETRVDQNNRSRFPLGASIYVGTSMADAAISLYIFRTLEYTGEGHAIAAWFMDKLGNEGGLATSLGMEYASVFGLSKLLPNRLRVTPIAIASCLHTMGFISNLHYFVDHRIIDMFYQNSTIPIATEKLVSYGQNLYSLIEKLF